MIRRPSLFLLLLAGFVGFLPGASGPSPGDNDKVINLRFPTFSDDQPSRRVAMLLAGTARFANQERTQIDATEVVYTTYKSTGEEKVDAVLTSPAATVFTDQEILRGDQSVKIVNDEVDITGERWNYFHKENKVTIGRNARVVFRGSLPSLLK
jgi:hypothetical protein